MSDDSVSAVLDEVLVETVSVSAPLSSLFGSWSIPVSEGLSWLLSKSSSLKLKALYGLLLKVRFLLVFGGKLIPKIASCERFIAVLVGVMLLLSFFCDF